MDCSLRTSFSLAAIWHHNHALMHGLCPLYVMAYVSHNTSDRAESCCTARMFTRNITSIWQCIHLFPTRKQFFSLSRCSSNTRASSAFSSLLAQKAPEVFGFQGSSLSYNFYTIILTYMLMPCWDKVCQPYFGTTKLFNADA